MTVKTFHDVYHTKTGGGPFDNELDKCAVVELQRYLNVMNISNYQISHSVERDKYDRLHTHILLIHD